MEQSEYQGVLYSQNYMENYDYDDYYIIDLAVEEQITSALNMYVLPFLLLVGVVGNVLCIVLMAMLGRLLSSCFYLSLLAVVDTFLLCLRGNVWLYNVADLDLTQSILVHSAVSCQVYSFICSLLLHLAGWLLASLMIEICLVTRNPAKVKTLCTAERAKNGILLVILLLTCLNAHFFWTYGLVVPFPGSPEKMCTFSPHGSYYNDYFRKIVWPIIDALAGTVLPSLAILISFCFIVTWLCVGRWPPARDVPALRNNARHHDDAQVLRGFIILCAILGICGLAFTLPFSTFNMYELMRERMRDEMDMAPNVDEQTSIMKRLLAQAITYTCRDVFLASKFFIYLACWAIFRSRMRKVATCAQFRVWVRKRRGKYTRNSHGRNNGNGPQRLGLRSCTYKRPKY